VTHRRASEPNALIKAFERLVRRHRSEIYRTILRQARSREDAEDLTQVTFLNAYAALQRGAEPEAPRAWLHAIARNAASRNFRQNRVDADLADEAAVSFDDDVLMLGELRAALARLTLNQRAAFLMREVGGLSAAEIGARLGVSAGAVATLLFRARRSLRAELDAAGFRSRPKMRSGLGGVSLLSASAFRWAWVRLLAPAVDGELLSRSAAVIGVAAGAIALTSTLPIPAGADHLRVGRVSEARIAIQRPSDLPARPRVQADGRFAAPRGPGLTFRAPPPDVRTRTPPPRARRRDSEGEAQAPAPAPAASRPDDGTTPTSPPAQAAHGAQPLDRSNNGIPAAIDAAAKALPAALPEPHVPAAPLVDAHVQVTIPDPSALPSAVPALPPASATDPTPAVPLGGVDIQPTL
jgi:RNA polymerase sigma-70 factor (ECF subfamily)